MRELGESVEPLDLTGVEVDSGHASAGFCHGAKIRRSIGRRSPTHSGYSRTVSATHLIVHVAGQPIAAYVTSGAPPPVVFVSQIGTDGPSWQPVLDRLTYGAQTVTYDRPGIGASPPRPAPNPPIPYSAHATELDGLLTAIGVAEPVVLVGHSVGGLIVGMFAAHQADRVSGLVMVDASIPRLNLWPPDSPVTDGDDPDATVYDVVAGEVEILAADYPDVPAVVLTRTPGRWDVDLPHSAIDDLWSVSQRRLARELAAPLVEAAGAGHQLPRQAPALVAYAVDAVVDAARNGERRCVLREEALRAAGGVPAAG